jgi:hypothetical protein
MYKKLEIDFELPTLLDEKICEFIDYINNDEKHLSEDCYRTEIACLLKDTKLNSEQIDLLKKYYVWGEIYNV